MESIPSPDHTPRHRRAFFPLLYSSTPCTIFLPFSPTSLYTSFQRPSRQLCCGLLGVCLLFLPFSPLFFITLPCLSLVQLTSGRDVSHHIHKPSNPASLHPHFLFSSLPPGSSRFHPCLQAPPAQQQEMGECRMLLQMRYVLFDVHIMVQYS